MTTSLTVGQQAPGFDLPTNLGSNVKLEDFKGKQSVVLYFYPKDMTPGCTQEAQDFRDLKAEFDSANAVILGVSKDTVEKHQKFCEKYSLPFPLLSDNNNNLCESYGVWKEKQMFAKRYMGIERTTILIDTQGVIRNIWPNVKVKGHAAEVLAAVKAL